MVLGPRVSAVGVATVVAAALASPAVVASDVLWAGRFLGWMWVELVNWVALVQVGVRVGTGGQTPRCRFGG